MRVHMRSINSDACQQSLFILLFDMMTDPNVRQHTHAHTHARM